MKIQFWSVGKDTDNYAAAGIKDFSKRAANYYPVSWNIIAPPKHAGQMEARELKKKEADTILKSLHTDDFLVALDENGKSMDSKKLAAFIQTRANESVKQLIFLIGGAYGLDQSVLQRANFVWSLSELTFPHQLARLILCEQVYRACTILRNEKYHHS